MRGRENKLWSGLPKPPPAISLLEANQLSGDNWLDSASFQTIVIPRVHKQNPVILSNYMDSNAGVRFENASNCVRLLIANYKLWTNTHAIMG